MIERYAIKREKIDDLSAKERKIIGTVVLVVLLIIVHSSSDQPKLPKYTI